MSASTSPLVQLAHDGPIARLTLNRPEKRNALTRKLIALLHDAANRVADDEDVRLLVLAARGPVFCAGMDLAEMQERAAQPAAPAEWQEDACRYRDLLVRLFSLPMPTLAIAQGPALAGGLGLLLACDMVLAAEEAFFALPEPQRGITAAVVTPLLRYRIGAGQAAYVLLSGRNVLAREALRIGLCHEVVPHAELAAREGELAASILRGAPAALATTKRFLHATDIPTLLEQLNAGAQVSAHARETDEAREGLEAFLHKRRPAWQQAADPDIPRL